MFHFWIRYIIHDFVDNFVLVEAKGKFSLIYMKMEYEQQWKVIYLYAHEFNTIFNYLEQRFYRNWTKSLIIRLIFDFRRWLMNVRSVNLNREYRFLFELKIFHKNFTKTFHIYIKRLIFNILKSNTKKIHIIQFKRKIVHSRDLSLLKQSFSVHFKKISIHQTKKQTHSLYENVNRSSDRDRFNSD